MRDRTCSLFFGRFALPLLLLALWGAPAAAQTRQPAAQPVQPAQPPDGVTTLLNRLEQLLQRNDRDNFPSLLSTDDITGDAAERATDDFFSYETTRAVVRERDRQPLESALPVTVIASSWKYSPRRPPEHAS
jgi:hypothetical protein